MKTIGIGIIGWGFMGKTHTHALRAIPLFYPGLNWRPKLVSVCSRRAESARQAADQLGFAHYTDDYRELLARPDVDVVSICTPNSLHEEMTIAALKAGKHVYVDKPLTTDGASALRVLAAAREANALSQMVLNNRFFPSTMRARQLIGEGRLGEIISFNCRYLHSGAVDSSRPAGWKQLRGAGVLLDLGSHALDLVTWLCGDIREGFCALRSLYPERPAAGGGVVSELADDQALMILRLVNGATGAIEASKIATGAEDELALEVYGTKGALRVEPMRQGYLQFYDNARPDSPLGGERGFTAIATGARFDAPGGSFLPPKNTIGWDRSHVHCYFSFLDCVANGRTPSPTIEDGARLQLLMDRLAQSNAEGRWVDCAT